MGLWRRSKKGEQYFTDYFLRLSPQTKYDVLTALRGPDYEEATYRVIFSRDSSKRLAGHRLCRLKSELVCRIRAIVFTDSDPNALICFDYHILSTQLAKTLATDIMLLRREGKYSHFLTHLHAAIVATRDHEIWGGHSPTVLYSFRA